MDAPILERMRKCWARVQAPSAKRWYLLDGREPVHDPPRDCEGIAIFGVSFLAEPAAAEVDRAMVCTPPSFGHYLELEARVLTFDCLDLGRVLRFRQFLAECTTPSCNSWGRISCLTQVSRQADNKYVRWSEHSCLDDLYLYRPELLLASKLAPSLARIVGSSDGMRGMFIMHVAPPNPRGVQPDARGRSWCEACGDYAGATTAHARCYFAPQASL